MGVTAVFAWMQSMLGLFGRGPVFAALVAWTGLFLAIVLNAVLFGTVYRFVPIQRIPWSCLLTGSVTAAVLWEIAKQLFRLYIERVGVYSAVYGSLGVTIALIMWVYYSAVVFVVGANVIRVLEERRQIRAQV
jgi:membrane protein